MDADWTRPRLVGRVRVEARGRNGDVSRTVPYTVRAYLEAIRDRHQMNWGGHYVGLRCDCGRHWPCRESQDAIAALAILDAAPHKRDERHVKTHRLVLDPEAE